METIQRDYGPKSVKFYYVYKALAHPERNGYITPFTIEERLMQVQEAKQKLGSRIDWLCDTMDNELKHALGNAQNSEFVFDPDGVVVHRTPWSDPEKLRKILSDLVGPAEKTTEVDDLRMNMEALQPSDSSITGVVPRLQVTERMQPLRIEPLIETEGAPFYVKLRAEVSPKFFDAKKGKLYLGFFLDRLYEMHWNNLVKPLEFELTTPPAVIVDPSMGSGPKVEAAADKDPREFLLDITAESLGKPLHLSVRYFACDDADTFCIPVTQKYSVLLERDPDGGTRTSGRRRRPGDFVERFKAMDQDGDGKLSIDEVPEGMKRRFQMMDTNGDGFIDESELQAAATRMRGGPGPGIGMVQRMMRFDLDGDGKISQEEASEPMRGRFDQMDTNGDGYLDREELEAAAEQMMRNRR